MLSQFIPLIGTGFTVIQLLPFILAEDLAAACALNRPGMDGGEHTLPANAVFNPVILDGDPQYPFADSPIKLKGTLLRKTGESVKTTLVPIGCTVLRRTTFPSGSVVDLTSNGTTDP